MIAVLAMRGVLVACSCGEGIYRPACEAFFDAGAVFVGTVVSRNGPERWPSYSVHVEENYKGLPKNASLVFVDSGLVCGGSFDLGAKYLFYAEQPKEWPGFTYSADTCSGSREVAYAAEDIAWLRRQAKQPQRARVYGTVLQNREWRSQRPVATWEVPLAGAIVMVAGKDRSYTAVSGERGEYSIEGVAAGKYSISAHKAPWIASAGEDVRVREGGCGRRILGLQSEGKMEGRLVDSAGKPVAGVDVELVRAMEDGSMAGAEVARATTDGRGRFAMDPVAAGEFVMGVNLRSAPQVSKPYAPTYFPGVPDLARAHRFDMGPKQQVAGLTMRLPVRMTAREVTVRVFLADGKPVRKGARAEASHRGRWAEGQKAAGGNQVRLTLLEGLEYEIAADWFDTDSQPVYWMDSTPVRLAAGRGPVVVNVRLRWIEPSRR